MNNDKDNRPQRPPMTPEQRRQYEERKRIYIERKRAERREAEMRRLKIRKRLILAVVFIVVLAIIFGTIAIILSVALHKNDPRTPELYTFKIGNDKEKVAFNDANRGGTLCINVCSLKKILGLTESSSRSDAVTFTARSSGSNVVFTNGNTLAVVNGQNISMPVAAVVGDKLCSVPLSIVSYIFSGINVTVKNSTITISRNDDDIEILAKSDDPLNMIIEFSANLDEYEEYMNPQGESRDNFLLLVNKVHPLGNDNEFRPENLVTMEASIYQGSNPNSNRLSITAYHALEAMLTEMRAEGINDNVYAISGYRSYSNQTSIYSQNNKDDNGNLKWANFEAWLSNNTADTAYPGYSEHQSGLCVDLWDTRFAALSNPFTDNATFSWLINNAWKFGYVLRYPSEKEITTGYSYESWHFRFVGRYHAEKIYRSGLTLDEYVASLG